jgi:hypothetical protein
MDQFSIFIQRITSALRNLREHIKFELVDSDILQWLSLTKAGLHPDDRRQGFPTEFSRMWMSNVA